MKGRILNFLVLMIMLVTAGCSGTKQPTELSSIAVMNSSASTAKISTMRIDGLRQVARGLGAQASLAWRSYQLNIMLNAQRRNLDRIFNFNHLILNQNVLPPVLAEGRNTLNLADDQAIRVSDQEYQIVFPPRFVTAPPNWRNYIWMSYKKPEDPNSTLLPQNAMERKIWNQYIHIGWQDGIAQADQIFASNLARLQRDYEGMVLYRKLLAQNMVTAPYVSRAELGVTGDANNIHINDRILRITSTSQLETNSKNWKPVISTKNKIARQNQALTGS